MADAQNGKKNGNGVIWQGVHLKRETYLALKQYAAKQYPVPKLGDLLDAAVGAYLAEVQGEQGDA